MFLQSLANAVPPRAFTQQECWDIFIQSETPARLKERSCSIVRKVLLGDNGIDRRHFALENVEELFELDAESLNRSFEVEAPKLASRALRDALERAELQPAELDGLIVCTCTGYICPGVSSHVAEQLGLRNDAFIQDIVGLGCGAAIPSLRNASHFIRAYPEARVAVIAVEICSAAFYLDDDPGVIISACLFGDGASASIWSQDDRRTGLHCDAFDTLHLPEQRHLLRFENRYGKLRNLLHRTVPAIAARAVSELYSRVPRDQIAQMISHIGGRDVLDAIEKALPPIRLRESREILRDHGNMSSPSVLFSLERYLQRQKVEKDLWLTAFGAGFAAHSCRLGLR